MTFFVLQPYVWSWYSISQYSPIERMCGYSPLRCDQHFSADYGIETPISTPPPTPYNSQSKFISMSNDKSSLPSLLKMNKIYFRNYFGVVFECVFTCSFLSDKTKCILRLLIEIFEFIMRSI